MSTAVFLLGFMCLGMPGAEVCHNIASQFLYLTLQCIKSDLIEAYTSYRPEVIPR